MNLCLNCTDYLGLQVKQLLALALQTVAKGSNLIDDLRVLLVNNFQVNVDHPSQYHGLLEVKRVRENLFNLLFI